MSKVQQPKTAQKKAAPGNSGSAKQVLDVSVFIPSELKPGSATPTKKPTVHLFKNDGFEAARPKKLELKPELPQLPLGSRR